MKVERESKADQLHIGLQGGECVYILCCVYIYVYPSSSFTRPSLFRIDAACAVPRDSTSQKQLLQA